MLLSTLGMASNWSAGCLVRGRRSRKDSKCQHFRLCSKSITQFIVYRGNALIFCQPRMSRLKMSKKGSSSRAYQFGKRIFASFLLTRFYMDEFYKIRMSFCSAEDQEMLQVFCVTSYLFKEWVVYFFKK